ncbi:MAG TPA: GxxExxY protein [bacterium]|nr:GxxExxY protein [bacterium]HPN35022.1 GxxExxY protein [bacterium]
MHEAQILTYMKLAKRSIGLLINFNVQLVKEGIRRFVLQSFVNLVPLWFLKIANPCVNQTQLPFSTLHHRCAGYAGR